MAKLKNLITTEKKIKNLKFFNNYKKYKNSKKKTTSTMKQGDFLIVLTSGSTSNPKPIVLNQKTKIFNAVELTGIEPATS